MVGKQERSTSDDRPRLAKRRAFVLGAFCLVAILMIGLWWVSPARGPDCKALRSSAEKDFAARRYAAAYDQLQPHARACTDGQKDPAERTKFTAVLATSAYGSGNKDEAKRYANSWRKWARSLGEKAPSGVVSTREAYTIVLIGRDAYALPQPASEPQDKGMRVPQ